MNADTQPAVLAERLRKACESVRRKSFPITDLIPLMQQAADALTTPQEAASGALQVQEVALDAARDTEMMDWLERNGTSKVYRLREGVRPSPDMAWRYTPNHNPAATSHYTTLRAAIRAAMKEQPL